MTAVGVQLPEVERPYAWSEVREIARTAEAVGLDSVWVGDHLLYRDESGSRGPWEAWSALAGLAEATERVLIGPLVAATAFHNPAMLAKKAATVDEMSGGRLVLGLGAGWNRTEFDAFGFPFDRRVARFEEAFTIIRTLLTDGAIDFDGEFHTLRGMELVPPARPDLPILIGSNGPRMLAATLPHVDAWNTWYTSYGNTSDGLAELVGLVDRVCDEVGRDRADIERTAAVYVHAPDAGARASGGRNDTSVPAITGSAEAVADQLAAIAGVGIEHLQVVLDPIDARSVEWLGSVREHVGPPGLR
jgi:alkanesulfonate monooxygenase SsuD/methylene tetrahydromethanopterin reductase-like flavin-dependent oxidoreductase (luciferase family)